MNETLQIIHEAYKKHQYRLPTKSLLLGGFGFALLNFLGVYFLGISAFPLKIINPITFLFDLVYNMIMFVLIQNVAVFCTIIFHEERDTVFASIQSSMNRSKKRMIGYYEIEEKIDEIQDQIISIAAYVTSLGKITDAEQLASVLSYIDEELKKIPKLQAKIEKLNKLKSRIKTLEKNDEERKENDDMILPHIARLNRNDFDTNWRISQLEILVKDLKEQLRNTVPLSEYNIVLQELTKIKEELRKLKGG